MHTAVRVGSPCCAEGGGPPDDLMLACDCSIIASERGHTRVVSTLLKQNANIKASTRYPLLAPFQVQQLLCYLQPCLCCPDLSSDSHKHQAMLAMTSLSNMCGLVHW